MENYHSFAKLCQAKLHFYDSVGLSCVLFLSKQQYSPCIDTGIWLTPWCSSSGGWTGWS